ncbi:anti-sigma factor family protein [Bacillus xiapuensis]|uniref:anti-sigma factor family protein n=1 Tax=Bacillus xiapuensis TaxID=2014075 RepID=UPI000C24DE8F|nr:anti-sigma factor [Bacillus xiapuensis]
MASCPKHIVEFMHSHLDGELDTGQLQELKSHLDSCSSCRQHFLELKKTIAFVQSTSHIQAPAGFTEKVLYALPKERKSIGVQRWFRQHPFFTAASLFLVLMTGGFFTMWQQGEEKFAFTKHDQLEVENHTVVVPAGKRIDGDIVVENGDIRIEGEVKGNVTVINGDKYMASAGKVSGEIEEVDEVFGWVWYKMKKTASDIFQ